MRSWQWAVILTEAVLICGVLILFAWQVRQSSFAPPPQISTSASAATPAGPTPTATITPTPFVWPTPLPTRTPFPTSTRVISRVSINQETIDKIEQQVIALREIKPGSPVRSEFLTRAEMVDYVRKQYEADRDEENRQIVLYRALGLVQPGVRVDPDTIIQTTAAGIAGFYDPQDKRLYVVSDLENMGADEKVTLAHEYSHALQDQQFDLARYQSRTLRGTTDSRLAMMALPEGDATVVMSLYLYGNTTRGDWEYLAYRAAFSDHAVITATGVSTRTAQITYFPYVQGAQFVVTLLLDSKGNWVEVNHAYADPPQATSQVMHPASYLTSHATPIPITLPDLGPILGQGWSGIIKIDTLGEFITSVHLDEFLHDFKRTAQAAEGWEGDSFTLWQTQDERQAFAWQIAWETQRDVGEFFDVYSDVLRKRIGSSVTAEREVADLHWYSGDAGSGLVRRKNNQTLVLWGPDRATVEKLLTLFK